MLKWPETFNYPDQTTVTVCVCVQSSALRDYWSTDCQTCNTSNVKLSGPADPEPDAPVIAVF